MGGRGCRKNNETDFPILQFSYPTIFSAAHETDEGGKGRGGEADPHETRLNQGIGGQPSAGRDLCGQVEARLEAENGQHAEARLKDKQLPWAVAVAAKSEMERLRASPARRSALLTALPAAAAGTTAATVPAATSRSAPSSGMGGPAGELREAEARLIAARQWYAEAEAEVKRLQTSRLAPAAMQAAEVETVGGNKEDLFQEGKVSPTAEIISCLAFRTHNASY